MTLFGLREMVERNSADAARAADVPKRVLIACGIVAIVNALDDIHDIISSSTGRIVEAIRERDR
jgi:hypothetical protein